MATAPTRARGRPLGEWQNQLPSALFDDAAFCTLNALQRLILIDCIRRADRHGRGMARPSQVRTYALDGLGVSDEQTAALLAEIPRLMAGSQFELILYEVDRNQYYAFPRWFEWQNIDYVPKQSRFPPPPDSVPQDPPTSPQGQPDGGADPPPAPAAPTGVPTSGEAQGSTQGEGEPERPQESADLSEVERARRSPEYREYEETCRNGELDRWLAPLSFEQLFRACLERGIDWRVLIEVAAEASSSAGGRPPNVRYGLSIIRNLPPDVKTREQAREHFARRRALQEEAPPPPRRGRPPKSNVFLRREQKDESYYDHIYKKFDAGPPASQEVT